MQPMGCGVCWICPGPCWLCVCVCVCVCAQSRTALSLVEVMTVGVPQPTVCTPLHVCANEETTREHTFFIVPPQDVLK
jgi:hypothetical protein